MAVHNNLLVIYFAIRYRTAYWTTVGPHQSQSPVRGRPLVYDERWI